MSERLKTFFEALLRRNSDFLAAVVTDKDGVPIVKATQDKVPNNVLRGSFLATFASATEQASKLGLSKNKTIVCSFSSFQVVQFNFLPLVVTIVATSQANTGLILSLENEFSDDVKEMSSAIRAISKD
ncbi:ragulator complex protein LAMTOR3-A-like [Dendronephthya gigantea]|uniref:ragulator complex protein LAMTOR3-A-like n=1 Tax=Dendronephthya gigantea TaxID=151771 RepID=UPI00106B3E8D|nr:ragulator complex protein LAMTOR3-A-like [Dendronephthya gigantea]XP_028414682.1 ragulator complex protein LAMTOR3-A-like [Dendronephthya gigantea]XP_028418583.1 ragulator complex protein LAMTOR3-A-like [Dendronephthya gigantea]